MPTLAEAKAALDKVIAKQRHAFYKPIQVAEILQHTGCSEAESCLAEHVPLSQIVHRESYRNRSKGWRDDVTRRLVGRVSISSARYQDDVFNDNAVPPALLAVLAAENCRCPHVVERYIYQAFWRNLTAIHKITQYIREQQLRPGNFDLATFFVFFEEKALRRSIDKAYEIAVYALFNTLTQHLQVQVSLSIASESMPLLREFEEFARMVLGIDAQQPTITQKAAFYRAGVTNAADKGVDIWANFGPVVQVKHVSLSLELAEDISESIRADWIVIVCKDAERDAIQAVASQLALRVRDIITQSQLETWYARALKGSFANKLAHDLIKALKQEFFDEFPSIDAFMPFYTQRGYDRLPLCDSLFWQEDPWAV